jgi:hypothetical protein
MWCVMQIYPGLALDHRNVTVGPSEKAWVYYRVEYQAMPILRDVAHDGVLCTFRNRSAPDWGEWYGPSGQAAWTVHHVQNHTLLGWVTLLQPAVLGQPSSLRPHWLIHSFSSQATPEP